MKKQLFKESGLKPSAKFSIYSLVILILFLTLMMTIGYSAMSSELNISGEAHFRRVADMRITEINLIDTTDGGNILHRPDYSINTIITGVNLPNPTSTISFEVIITNFTDLPMTIREINLLNTNNSQITYQIDGISINDEIKGFEVITFQITFAHVNQNHLEFNPNHESRIEFVFAIYDNDPPEFTLVNNATIYFINQLNEDILRAKVTAYDNVDGNVTDQIQMITNINFNNPLAGIFTVTYNVSDQAGNSAVHTINITLWNFTSIVSGQNHSIALTSHGEVWTWGANDVGQRGQGVTGNSNNTNLRVPTQIPQSFFDNLPVTQIASGQNTGYALNSAGHIFAWGNNASNRIGDGTTTNRNRPVRTGLGGTTGSATMTFTQVDSQWSNAVAIGTDGNIWTWGDQAGSGALGDNSATNRARPVRITTSNNFVYATMGRFGGVAITDEGHVYVWGTNLNGQLGAGATNPETAANRFTPRQVPDLENIVKVDYGERHILALSADGYVYGWGQGTGGRLGNGETTANITRPRRLNDISGVSDINAGNQYSQLRIGNNIYSFGPNADGRLFDGTATTGHTSPNKSQMQNIVDNVKDISGHSENSFILSSDGTTVWGVGRSTLNNQSFGRFFPTSGAATAVVVNATPALSWDFTPPEPR